MKKHVTFLSHKGDSLQKKEKKLLNYSTTKIPEFQV